MMLHHPLGLGLCLGLGLAVDVKKGAPLGEQAFRLHSALGRRVSE